MHERLISTEEAAALLGLAPSTLCVLRVKGGGPRYVKLRRRVVYDPADVYAYVEERKRTNTSEPSVTPAKRVR